MSIDKVGAYQENIRAKRQEKIDGFRNYMTDYFRTYMDKHGSISFSTEKDVEDFLGTNLNPQLKQVVRNLDFNRTETFNLFCEAVNAANEIRKEPKEDAA